MKPPYCGGAGCPVRETCDHFKEVIDVMKEIHFSDPPFNHTTNRCPYHPLEREKSLNNRKNGRASHGPVAGDL